MIYTVTLNPTLDITFVVDELTFDGSTRARETIRTPGGKGLNVSRVLRAMGLDSIAMGVIGSYVGSEVMELLQREGLILQVIRISENTRTNVVILEKANGREMTINSKGPVVQESVLESISDLILKASHTPEIMVLSGSIPRGVGNDIYYQLIRGASKRGSRVILDSSGEPLRKGIEANPFMIKPNIEEISFLAGRKLSLESELVEFSRKLIGDNGIEVVIVSMGGNGAIMVTAESVWKGEVPFIDEDTVGAGDSLVAGVVMGIFNGEAIRQGISARNRQQG